MTALEARNEAARKILAIYMSPRWEASQDGVAETMGYSYFYASRPPEHIFQASWMTQGSICMFKRDETGPMDGYNYFDILTWEERKQIETYWKQKLQPRLEAEANKKLVAWRRERDKKKSDARQAFFANLNSGAYFVS